MKFSSATGYSSALMIGLALALGACATGQPVVSASAPDQKAPADASNMPNALQVTDIALPPGSRLDTDSSLIIGTSDRWLGRIAIKTDTPSVQTYNHFFNGMPALGWSLITALQAKNSVLTYQRGDRIALIQLEPSSLNGTVVSITVSPRQPAGPEPAKQK